MALERTVDVIIRGKDFTRRAFTGLRRRMRRLRRSAADLARSIAKIGAVVGGAITGLGLLADRGRKVANVQRTFARLTGDQEAAIQKLRKASRGLIDDFELMAGHNQALALGSAKNVDQFAEMIEVSLALADAQGIEASRAVESLNTGIARQSVRWLDNLGIMVSVADANRRYAAALNKTVEQLTDAEKREAFRIAAMDAARRLVSELSTETDVGTEAFARMKTTLFNVRDEFAKLVAKSPRVAEFFGTVEQAVVDLRRQLPGLIDQLFRLGRAAVDLVMPGTALSGQLVGAVRRGMMGLEDGEQRAFLEGREQAFEQRLAALARERNEIVQRFLDEGIVRPGEPVRDLGVRELVARGADTVDIRALTEEIRPQMDAFASALDFVRQQLEQLGAAASRAAGGGGGAGIATPGPLRHFGLPAGRLTEGLFGTPGPAFGIRATGAPSPFSTGRASAALFRGLSPSLFQAEAIRIESEVEEALGDVADDIKDSGTNVVGALAGVASGLSQIVRGGSFLGGAGGILGGISSLFKAGSDLALGFGVGSIALSFLDAITSSDHENTIRRGVGAALEDHREFFQGRGLIIARGALNEASRAELRDMLMGLKHRGFNFRLLLED